MLSIVDYIKENVLDSITDHRFFSFRAMTYKDNYDSSYDITGYYCQPATNIKLSGKITIPDSYNGAPIIGLDQVMEQESLTHIYFKNPETVRVIGDINRNPNLKVFKFPIGLRLARATTTTGGRASGFRENPAVKFDAEGFAACRLARIETSSYFSGSFDMTNQIELFQLPGTLQYISSLSFYNLGSISSYPPNGQYRIVEVRFGGPNDPSQLNINSVVTGANIFLQRDLVYPPSDIGASTLTPIKTYTFYKDPITSFPDDTSFRSFCDGDKVSGTNDIIETQVIDADVSLN
mgnify:CR=1 FL=1